MTDKFLYREFDSTKWAKEFMRIFGNRLNDLDESTMHAWFANAIMAGYDYDFQTELDGLRAKNEKLKEEVQRLNGMLETDVLVKEIAATQKRLEKTLEALDD